MENSVQQLLMRALIGATPRRFNDVTVSIDAVVRLLGTGLGDLTSSGIFNDTVDHLYTIKITAADKFQWKKDNGSYSMDVTITGSAQTLSEGVEVTFGHTTGYTINDEFTIQAHAGVAIPAKSLVNIDINNVGSENVLQIYNGTGTDGELLYEGSTGMWENGENILRKYTLSSQSLYVVMYNTDTPADVIVGYN